MTMRKHRFNRRAFLPDTGVTMASPWMESANVWVNKPKKNKPASEALVHSSRALERSIRAGVLINCSRSRTEAPTRYRASCSPVRIRKHRCTRTTRCFTTRTSRGVHRPDRRRLLMHCSSMMVGAKHNNDALPKPFSDAKMILKEV